MTNITKITDRVRKLLALADSAGSEHEAAAAASRAAQLMAEYQLDEAALRVDAPELPPEPIEQSARLEPDAPLTGRKRVAWKETIALAVAQDLGVRMHYLWHTFNGRKQTDVCGFGRESAIQTWRYTCQYLWRTIDELAEASADCPSWQSVRAYRNAFRVGCAARIAERIYLARIEREKQAPHIVPDDECAHRRMDTTSDGEPVCRDCGLIEPSPTPSDRTVKALAIVNRDREEVDAAYAAYSKGFGTVASVGSTSSRDGYNAGRSAGDRVSLGGARAGLPAGQGRLRGSN